MRGRSLSLCLDDLRAELLQATTVNLGQAAREQLVRKLQSAQETLHLERVWPHKRVWETKNVSAGSRYLDFPTRLKLENIREVRALVNGKWSDPLVRGVGPEQYNAYNSDDDERADPITRWDVREVSGTAQIEVHPLPATSVTGGLSLIGAADLLPFVDDADVCDLDSNAIVLTAAADYLERTDVAKAQILRAKAEKIVNRLVGGSGKTKNRYTFAGGCSQSQARETELRVVYARE
jgi:hypothetical protein